MPSRFLLAFLAAALFSAAAAAQDEHRRRLAAELVVMAGDVRRVASGAEPALHREGLQDRLAGALSSLPLLLRRAGGEVTAVPALRVALARRDWRTLSARLNALHRKYPLDLSSLLPARATPERLRLGEAIHKQACAGCHNAPATATKLPAFNLFEQVRHMPRAEFAARLLIGVRGDRSTAWRNPFSDLEIGALMAYYENEVSVKANIRVTP
ncbi:MAG: cytochrome c [Betaproteobacteria bacterium]|nr:cytochrome c [Betaproteobacteria bacterium]